MLEPPREDQLLRMWPGSIPAFRVRNPISDTNVA